MQSFIEDLTLADREYLLGQKEFVCRYGDDLRRWPEDFIRREICRQKRYPWIEVKGDMVDYNLFREMGDMCRNFGFLPAYRGRIALHVFMTEPFLSPRIRALRNAYHVEIHPIGTSELSFDRTLSWLEAAASAEPATESKTKPPAPEVISWNYHPSEKVEFIERMLKIAYLYGASDVFLDTYPDKLDIRFLVGGSCIVMPPIDGRYAANVISDCKAWNMMAQREQRGYRDGSSELIMPDGVLVNFRTVAQRSLDGESITLRLLVKSNITKKGKSLPFEPAEADIVRKLITLKEGMILMCGPTGSGKTTTLWAMLMNLDPSAMKIMTIEDPVEYRVPGFIQLPVKGAQSGVGGENLPETFPKAVRSCMRAKPNVILVGEMRDAETCAAAVEAALTGHLVFSSVHAPNSTAALARLTEKGVSNLSLQQTVKAIIAQRLVPKLCECHKAVPITDEQRKHFSFHSRNDPIPEKLYIENGCPKCGGTGRSGMVPVYELFVPSGEILQKMGVKGDMNLDDIRRFWVSSGGVTMVRYALRQAAKGVINYEEARSIDPSC